MSSRDELHENPALACLHRQRTDFLREQPVLLATRLDRIERCIAMLLQHRHALLDALMQDFPVRGADWTLLAEVFAPLQAFLIARKQLPKWLRPQSRRAPLAFRLFGASAQVEYQPLGVVGIMAAWNAPLNLLLAPLAGVMAAGNRAMLCPSDQMPVLAEALEFAVGQFFSVEELVVARGGLEVCKRFSTLPFDHLMFTGSPEVGAQVMAAAARNLVPVTLELGGKCPVILGEDADLADTAARLIDAKTLNAGQACLAPDLVLVPRKNLDALVLALRRAMRVRYPGGVENPHYCGLLHARHLERAKQIIAQVRDAGVRVEALSRDGTSMPEPGEDRRRLDLHLLIDPPSDSRAMREELFCPLLVLKAYDKASQACDSLRELPKPLGLYVFSSRRDFVRQILDQTFSGGVTVNDAMLHYSVPDLPFGGVGRSGIGAYSFGIEGFRRFSHARAIYRHAGPRSLMGLMQPPYGRVFDWVVRGQLERLSRRYEQYGQTRRA